MKPCRRYIAQTPTIFLQKVVWWLEAAEMEQILERPVVQVVVVSPMVVLKVVFESVFASLPVIEMQAVLGIPESVGHRSYSQKYRIAIKLKDIV